MKGKNNQEETYFLGKAQETRYTKSHIYKKVFGIAACVIAIIGITLIFMFKPQNVSQPHVLKTIAVLPEGGQMPIFNGNGDINDFLRWVMTNIQYPKDLDVVCDTETLTSETVLCYVATPSYCVAVVDSVVDDLA